VAERLSEDEAQYVADEHFYFFTHHDQFYRVRRDIWDEIFANAKAHTDIEHDEVTALAVSTSWPPSATNPGASITSFRGRSGRQGDPGSSRFFLSLQDDLLRIFGGERMQNLMLRLAWKKTCPSRAG